MKVRELMTSDIETASPETTLDRLARSMKQQDVGAIPIVEDGDLIGIVTDRDIVLRCIAEGTDPQETEAEEILSGDMATIGPDDDVQDAADLMGREQIRRLPVVEDGELVGMISLGDLAVKSPRRRPAAKALEDVSDGVKATNKGGGGRAQLGKRDAGLQVVHDRERNRQTGRAQEGAGARGRAGQKSSARGPGISSHDKGEEEKRQGKVSGRRAG